MNWKRRLGALLSIGLTGGLPFEESRKIRMVNLLAFLGAVLVTPFILLNLLRHYYGLALINAITFASCLSLSLLQYFRLHKPARYAAVIGCMVLFSGSAILYRNEMEYFLILNLAGILLLFDETVTVMWLLALDMACFVFVKISQQFITPLGRLSWQRDIINIATFLLGIVMTLLYYRYQQRLYRNKLEKINQYLNEKSTTLEELNRTKEKIFSILSHDLRQPLLSVKSLLQMMNREMLTPDMFRDFSGKINGNLDNIILSLDNTLHWSLAQFKGIKAIPEDFHVCDVTAHLHELLQENLLRKHLLYADYIPVTARLYADREHVTIILRNLISNAIKFTPRGGFINISALEKETEWELSVEDSGIGMEEAVMERLFDIGRHLTRRGTDNEKGTGVGLSLVKELVEMNGGTIVVKSIPGKGTTFSFTLEKVREQEQPEEKKEKTELIHR